MSTEKSRDSEQGSTMAERPSSSQADLQKYGKDFDLTLKPKETPEERKSRLRREEADAEHHRKREAADAELQRKKELLILWAVLMIVGAMTFVCVVIVFLPGAPPENSKWATMFLTTIGSAGIGYMTGKNSK